MINQINTKIFTVINHFAGSSIVLDKFVIIMAQYMPFLFIGFLIYLWFRKNDSKDIALYSVYSAVLGLSLNFIITLIYFHPRPFMQHIGKLLIKHGPDSSFPSDHTTLMLSIAFILLYFRKTRNSGIILLILGLIGGLSRVYCGVHYPFDILGSTVVGLVTATIIFLLKRPLQKVNEVIVGLYYRLLKI